MLRPPRLTATRASAPQPLRLRELLRLRLQIMSNAPLLGIITEPRSNISVFHMCATRVCTP